MLVLIFLVVAGLAAYIIAGYLIKPEIEISTNKVDKDTNKVTLEIVKELTPQNVQFSEYDDKFVLSFDTAKPTRAYAYVTPERNENFLQVVRDFSNGLPVAGKWFFEQSETETTTHQIVLPLAELPKPTDPTNSLYVYILIKYKDVYIPYGQQTSLSSGPLEPWVITILK